MEYLRDPFLSLAKSLSFLQTDHMLAPKHNSIRSLLVQILLSYIGCLKLFKVFLKLIILISEIQFLKANTKLFR